MEIDPSNGNGNDNDATESPLSPTSAEILGKLTQPRKASSGKKPEPLRQADDTPVRKLKRPQPVVAAAYRYVEQSKSDSSY
jgi:hypothetical protein